MISMIDAYYDDPYVLPPTYVDYGEPAAQPFGIGMGDRSKWDDVGMTPYALPDGDVLRGDPVYIDPRDPLITSTRFDPVATGERADWLEELLLTGARVGGVLLANSQRPQSVATSYRLPVQLPTRGAPLLSGSAGNLAVLALLALGVYLIAKG